MVYESTINFTLDTICPWTYIAHTRLLSALSQHTSSRSTDAPAKVSFKLHYHPYMLHPTLPTQPISKHDWYVEKIYHGSAENVSKYEKVMTATALDEGLNFSFKGEVNNTLPAHRAIFWTQETYGVETAQKVVEGLFAAYFTHEQPPATKEAISHALIGAGIKGEDVEEFLKDENRCRREVERAIAEQEGNEVDAVPWVIVEGRRRDFTLKGCKSVEEYLKCLEGVVRESS